MTNSTTRDEFEAWMRSKNACVRLHRQREELGGFYRTTTVQRAWEQWQAARRAALLEAMADLQKLLEVAGQEDESGIVVAINALRALADEGMKP